MYLCRASQGTYFHQEISTWSTGKPRTQRSCDRQLGIIWIESRSRYVIAEVKSSIACDLIKIPDQAVSWSVMRRVCTFHSDLFLVTPLCRLLAIVYRCDCWFSSCHVLNKRTLVAYGVTKKRSVCIIKSSTEGFDEWFLSWSCLYWRLMNSLGRCQEPGQGLGCKQLQVHIIPIQTSVCTWPSVLCSEQGGPYSIIHATLQAL